MRTSVSFSNYIIVLSKTKKKEKERKRQSSGQSSQIVSILHEDFDMHEEKKNSNKRCGREMDANRKDSKDLSLFSS